MEVQLLIADDYITSAMGVLRCAEDICPSIRGLIDTAASEVQLSEALKRKKYTHLILDLTFGNESVIGSIDAIKSRFPNLTLLIFSAESPEFLEALGLVYDIKYILPKEANKEETEKILRLFLNRELPPGRSSEKKDIPLSRLSPREMETLHYMLKGIKPNQIAAKLGVNRVTIATFKARIFEKMGVSNEGQLKKICGLYGMK